MIRLNQGYLEDNLSVYTTLTNLSMNYLVMCNVYTGVGGIKCYTMFVHLYVR